MYSYLQTASGRTVRAFITVMCAGILLSACAGLREESVAGWPADIPPASYFLEAYASDTRNHDYQTRDEYLYWVRSFYEGTTLYPRGWNDVTEAILAETAEPKLAAERQAQLATLGRDIATEWSKDSSISLVKSSHLAVWGVATERAVGEDNVEETLELITEDLQQLLARELDPDAVTAGRYHPEDPNDWFAW